MKIGDRVFVRGYIDEIRKDTVIIRNAGGYFGTIPSEVITGELPSAQPDIARDIATIIENEKDMRVIVKNAQPEIIRCKDCKHFWLGQCGLNGLTWSYDSFCSRAERRTDERFD